MVTELVVGMVLGLAIGLGLDALFGTRPVFLVVFALLGFAGGVRTMLRTAEEVQRGRGEAALMARDPRTGRDRTTSEEPMAKSEAAAASTSTRWSSSRSIRCSAASAVHWYTLTNATLWMALAVVARQPADDPARAAGRWCRRAAQSIAESVYGFAYKMIEDVTGKEGLKYFPYIMTLFLFILFANVLALIPAQLRPDLAHRGDGDPRARGLHHA